MPKTRILKLARHDEKKELEFEVSAGMDVSPDDRLSEWLEWNLAMLEFLNRQTHEPRKNSQRIQTT